ncbi:hypothetical protein, partial [Actinomadura rubrisoli]
MSINVDDSGAHRLIPDTPALPAATGEPRPRTALARFKAGATSLNLPHDYRNAIRHGEPGDCHSLVLDGVRVFYTLAARSKRDCCWDYQREAESWREFRAALAAEYHTGIHPELPREIAAITYIRDSERVHLCRPGSHPGTRRRLRDIWRRWTALSPLPLLGALTQPLAGSATAVGIALAPVMP